MKAKVLREKLKAGLKLAKKVSGGIGDNGRLVFLTVRDNLLLLSTLDLGAQWLTMKLDLESGESGWSTVQLEELLKVVDRLETEHVTISVQETKLKVQGGRRRGTLPTINMEFPVPDNGDNIQEAYSGENTFKKALKHLASVSLDVSTQWGCIRLGGDGFAGASDTGNLFWTKVGLIEGLDREVLIPAKSLSVVSDISGIIQVKLSDSLLVVTSEHEIYRCALSAYSVPPYASIIEQRVQGERHIFHPGLVVSEMEDYSKVSKEAAQVIIQDGQLTIQSLPSATTEFKTTKDWDGNLTCRFLTRSEHFLKVARLMPSTCELVQAGTSHIVMVNDEDVAIVSCLDGSLSFETQE